jgi:hypothetical protein
MGPASKVGYIVSAKFRAELEFVSDLRSWRDDETRTRDLCRDRETVLGFTTTYKYAGTAKYS